MPKCAAMVVMLTIRPHPRAAISGANPAPRKKGPRTLLANIASKAAVVVSAVGPNEKMPALLTKISTLPTSFSDALARSDAAGSIPARHDDADTSRSQCFGNGLPDA